MDQLSIFLPPFSSDYAGVCSALFDLNCMVIINDANCCTSNYVYYDEPRWAVTKKPTFCSELRILDAILGDDDKFICQTVNAALKIKPDFIAILGSPVPAIIGMDMAGVAKEIEVCSNIPTLGFNTTGFSYYDHGVSQAALALVKRFTDTNVYTIPNGVNILGLTPLDFSANENSALIEQRLDSCGFEVICSFFMQTSLDRVRRAGNAAVNLVVAQSGLAAAKLMQDRFGIPYVAALPVGIRHSESVMEAVRQTAADRQTRIINISDDTAQHEAVALLIGDQVIINSIRSAMRIAGSGLEVIAASFFDMAVELMLPGDVKLRNENHLITLLRRRKFDRLLADPLMCRLPAASASQFYSLPHPAISSRIYWNDVPLFMTREFENFIHCLAE